MTNEPEPAAIARVRALHRKASHGETCVYCAHGQRLGYDTTWPCDTIRALDGTAAPAAVSAAVAPPTNRAAPFGSPDCTCVPFTRKEGMPRACGPDDTVDDISGWETGRDCPHHASVASPTDPTHGLSVPHADALWDAVAIPGPHTPTYPEQHERVCRAVRDILDELTPARDDAVAQTALRDRIADKLTAAAYECDGKCGLSERECYDAHPITFSAMAGGTTHVDGSVTAIADAVLAELPSAGCLTPEYTDGPCHCPSCDPAAHRTDRAALLRELATQQEQTAATDVIRRRRSIATARRLFAAELRRMADETATEHRPAVSRWRVETLDNLANEWAPGTGWPVRALAVERFDAMNAKAPRWKDGTPVTRRLVRETTTYTVEAETGPAAGARQDGAES